MSESFLSVPSLNNSTYRGKTLKYSKKVKDGDSLPMECAYIYIYICTVSKGKDTYKMDKNHKRAVRY